MYFCIFLFNLQKENILVKKLSFIYVYEYGENTPHKLIILVL